MSWNRIGAASGILHVLLVVVGFMVIAEFGGVGGPWASTEEIANSLAEADATRIWIGENVETLGFLFFVLFAAYLWRVVGEGERELAWLATAGFAAALVYVTIGMASGLPTLGAAHFRVDEGIDPQVAAALIDVRDFGYHVGLAFIALWLATVGAVVVRTRVLPVWIGWSAVALSAAQLAVLPFSILLPDVNITVAALWTAWIVAVSVVLFRRDLASGRTRTPAPPAEDRRGEMRESP